MREDKEQKDGVVRASQSVVRLICFKAELNWEAISAEATWATRYRCHW